jgi:hypothetical protein
MSRFYPLKLFSLAIHALSGISMSKVFVETGFSFHEPSRDGTMGMKHKKCFFFLDVRLHIVWVQICLTRPQMKGALISMRVDHILCFSPVDSQDLFYHGPTSRSFGYSRHGTSQKASLDSPWTIKRRSSGTEPVELGLRGSVRGYLGDCRCFVIRSMTLIPSRRFSKLSGFAYFVCRSAV